MTLLNKFTQKPNDPARAFSETPEPDMRWIDLLTGERTCPCCNTPLRDLLSLACSAPEEWYGDNTSQDNDAFHTATGDILTHDFCRIQDRHFVRTVMLLPFHDIESCLILGIWVHLDKPSFDQFYETYPSGEQRAMDMQFGGIANIIPGDPGPHACCIQPRDGFQRPITHAALEEDALYGLQLDGMSFEMLITMLEEYGHTGLSDQTG